MRLTKYRHACIVLEEQGQKLVIDPGEFSTEFGGVDNIAAVIVTHIHGDHFSAQNLQTILTTNQNAKVFTTPEVAAQWQNAHVVAVKAGDKHQVGPFALEFFGEKHSEIHALKPVADNVGVMVNEQLYYPGDSLTTPGRAVPILALPANAPWIKVSESIEFLKAIQPTWFFRQLY